ncbi:hypothetical protein [Aliivibrio fischeri]|uniref:Uncharacterized protein n=1 Tax=Aliivibrio fischeri TaxID=668 RepID=A0A510UDD6_ALIFS|nr:hypothetical protein [Aliivibrio fischeri]GEK12577.1 hypothetical protein AFI02nite_06130 [Aliivibrio fischeri]
MIKLIFQLIGTVILSCGVFYGLWILSYSHLFGSDKGSWIMSFRYGMLAIIGMHVFLGLACSQSVEHINNWLKYKKFNRIYSLSSSDKKAMFIAGIIGIAPYFINNYYIEKYDFIQCESDLFIDRDDFYFARYVSSMEQCPIKLEANKK